ncbi:COX15/CtaA family protein [Glycomyces sp. TRM65418]|uniref:COX15/CtaA family protein n=1 Tax=Glycomyces sp. TRM65418 TaxID=2867006 RepID=UPI001CE506F9|nr:COX15/CtaA family protein [Glycomyces sp. TRM65418]MCC3764348.1 COX15/CtaA family protein [Glycomyces sp. TRM65418]QZD54027.1 COX15/CtaA family protein [Glycomyces sp. TRM65418]
MNLLQRWFARPGAVRRWALASVIANVGIIVTGGAVRLTESGLGCPEWPKCTADSLVATPEMGIYGAIEFGNRALTGVLIAVAVGALLAAWLRVPRRMSLVKLAAAGLLYVPAQAVIGGITVWTNLNPWVVGLHFLASIPLVAISVALYLRSGEPDGAVVPLVPRAVTLLARWLVAVAGAVIVLGVVVTGSGPHAGDADTPRNGMDPELMSQLHADLVWLLLGMTVALIAALHAVKAPETAKRAAYALLAVELLQGVIGYTQYYLDLPALLVGMHMLGAGVLWVAAVAVPFSLRKRRPQVEGVQPLHYEIHGDREGDRIVEPEPVA